MIPSGGDILVIPWGGALPASATMALLAPVSGAGIAVLPNAASANDARNLALESRTGAVQLLDAHERLSPAAGTALANPPAAGQWVRSGPAHRASSYLWGPAAAPRFRTDHGRFPQASLPTTSPSATPVSASEDFVEPAAAAGAGWGVPFGTTPAVAAELPAFVAVASAGVAGRAEWLTGFLAEVLPTFLDDLEHAKDPAPLGALLAELTGSPWGRGVLAGLPAEQRVRAWLAAEGRFAELHRLTALRWYAEGQAPTEVRDGRILLDLDIGGLPDEARAVTLGAEAFLARAWRDSAGVRFGVFTALRWVDFEQHPPTVTATWLASDGRRIPAEVSPASGNALAAASRQFRQWFQCHDAGSVVVSLTEPLPAGDWQLQITVGAAGLTGTTVVGGREGRGSAGLLGSLAGPWGTPGWDRDRGLVLRTDRVPPQQQPLPQPTAPTAVAVSADETSLTVLTVGTPAGAGFSMRAGEWMVPGESRALPDGRTETRFSLAHDPWGLGQRPVPPGTWHIAFQATASGSGVGKGRSLAGEVAIGPALAEATPWEEATAHHRLRITRGLRDQLLITTSAPLAAEELGPVRQQRLRAAYANVHEPVDPNVVLFTTYAGTNVTDSPHAIFEELRSRASGHRLLWAVADSSVLAPSGSTPVLRLSAAWYDALARAGTIVTNIEMERWFRRRPDQRLVQTFHGYPSKSMGKQLWRSKNMSPSRIDQMVEQTSAQWSLLLTPDPEMDRHYREQYDYRGAILNRGYPRDDVLVGQPDELAARRAAARSRLGIAEDRIAVLYAPTWRDDQATNFRSAAWVNYLDLDRAVSALEDRYLFLIRGHRFQKPPVGATRRRLLEVTGYPEINDLILASDAAVVDYSSIRFDLALAGIPQVFLVPDLDSYTGDGRGFLYPFLDSAPGPLVTDTDQVVAELADLEALVARNQRSLGAFRQRFLAHQDGAAASRVVDWMLD